MWCWPEQTVGLWKMSRGDFRKWKRSPKLEPKYLKFFHPEAFKNSNKNTYGFKTTAKAPKAKPDCPSFKPYKEFQTGMLDLISNVKFNKRSNEHLERMKRDVAKISKEQRVFVSADKTSNLYLVPVDKYRELLHKSVHKEY